MKNAIQYISANWKPIIITLLVIIVAWKILDWSGALDKIKGKFSFRKATTNVGSDGSTVTNYSPRPDSTRLKNAMSGWGTDEEMIWNVLEDKTDEQLAALYNDFHDLTGENLFDWFEDDLSGEDLSRALAYFKNLNF